MLSDLSEKSLACCRYLAILVAIMAPISTAVTSVACVVMILAWIISGQVGQSLNLSIRQPTGKILLLFFVWLAISSLNADTSWDDRITTFTSWKKLFFTFVLLGLFYQREWKTRFIHYYLAAMSLAAVITVLLWLLDFQTRGAAGIIMTNYTSQSIAFVVALLCCIFLLKESTSPKIKALLIVMIGLFIVNIFFISASRSGYLALPVAAVFLVVNLYGFKKLPHILAITATVLLLVALTSNTLQQRVKLGLEEKNNVQTSEALTSIGVRDIFRQNTLELIVQKPLLGYGTSSFKSVYSNHVATKYQDWRNTPTSDPHNQYLFVWMENGLVGLLLFLAYIFTAVRQGVNQQSYGAVAASVLVALTVTSLFNSHFKTFSEGNLLAFFVGCLLSTRHAEADSA